MTLVILALDALDWKLTEEYDADALRLSNATSLETFSHKLEYPYTLEVWPSVATGLHPDDHGITSAGASDWDNPLISLGSEVLRPLPHKYRARLGEYAESLFGANWDIAETDEPTFFDGDARVVHNWPGVKDSHTLQARWELMGEVNEDARSRETFDRDVLAEGAEKFGWLEEMLNHDVEVAAAHIHVLDLAGHTYGSYEDHYKSFYDWTTDRVERLLDAMGGDDELVILSDHGMGVESIEDDEPGVHSWRAMFSTTMEGDLPESVFDVREWVEERVDPVELDGNSEMGVDTEHLEDLGYL